MEFDLDELTLSALDWTAVLAALSERARTARGRHLATRLRPGKDLRTVHRLLDEVDEILALEGDGGFVPVGAVEDVAHEVGRAAKGAALDRDELRRVGLALQALDQLGAWLLDAEADAPTFQLAAPRLRVDPAVIAELAGAFDEAGELSARRWPELGVLRARIAELHGTIRRTLEELVKGDTLGDVLQDRFVTQRGDRYVVPVKANFKRKELGIVHGMSGSGQTAFVEPQQVVALNNELRMAEGQLEAAERRILAELSAMVGRVAEPALDALDVATTIDLAAARADLARSTSATRPIVRDEGVLRLHRARHPLLTLRGIEVVPNDVALVPAHPVLVVSGPNTGGKTIVLKTVGLSALLARIGCFVPADEGSRVDLFPDVVALIGDHQTVHGDHSSFSSHVAALRDMLERARAGALYLVDEIASGTDPSQGAALAHAIIERLLDAGARALITTHFHRLKTLATVEPRVAMGGMQFEEGRPTYRLILGASGESHALEIASRLGVDPAVVQRARSLMDEGERSLAETLVALEQERARAEDAARRAAAQADELARREARVAAHERHLEARARQIEQERAAAFTERLKQAEQAISAVVADLQRNPSHDRVKAARGVVDALSTLAPSTKAPEPEPPDTDRPLEPGDRVRLTRLHDHGEVVSVGRQLQVRTSRGLVVRVKPSEAERLPSEPDKAPARAASANQPTHRAAPATSLDAALRHGGNTLDLRGKRVDEGLEEVERFLDQALMESNAVVFVLHGHGTGAMKQAVRSYLRTAPHVAAWQPAGADQGGDAYTVAALR